MLSSNNTSRFSRQHRYLIDASTEASLNESLASVGNEFGIANADTGKTLNWLSRTEEEWVLLYDNADDPKVPLRSFLPDCRQGNILITTRNTDLRTLAPKSHLEVSVLEESAAVKLLLELGLQDETAENEKEALKIVQDFGCLALAVVQAASYIATRSLDLTEYYSMYKSSRRRILENDLGPDIPYRYPVFTTWEISYSALSPTAQTLLDICSFLYREGITEEIFSRAVTDFDPSKLEKGVSADDREVPSEALRTLVQHLRDDSNGWSKTAFIDLMHDLRSYSLVQEPFKGVFSIHPLVHQWASDRMTPSQRALSRADALCVLYYALPSPRDSVHISVSRMLLPHLDSCGMPKDIKIAGAYASAYERCGRWSDEETLREYLVDWCTRNLGRDHPDTLRNMYDLGWTYSTRGRLEDAEKVQLEVLEARRRLLGDDHRDTLSSMSILGSIYQQRGRYNEAEKLQVETVETSKRLLGLNHLHTLTDMNNLAGTYARQGRWTDAEKPQVEVLEARKRLLGAHHLDTLSSMFNLASTYHSQGRFDDAEKLSVEVVETRKQLLGAHHPDTLRSVGNLALTYWYQGRYDEAEKLQVEAMEMSKQVLGDNHPDTLHSMRNLANTYMGQDRLADAEKLQMVVMEARKQVLGVHHPDSLLIMNNLAGTYMNQSRLDDAERLLIEVVQVRKRLHGLDHPETLRSMGNLITTYRLQGRDDDAKKLEEEIEELNQAAVPADP